MSGCGDPSRAVTLVDQFGAPIGVLGNQLITSPQPQPIAVNLVAGGLDFQMAMADAFGRLRVSNPQTLYDSKQVYDNDAGDWWEVPTAGGSFTYTANRSSTYLNVTAANGDAAVRQTKRYFNYQPGKSQLIFMTFVMGAAAASLRRRAGIFSVNDGIFLEQNGTTDVRFVQRTSTSGAPSDAYYITQPFWNLDPLNGSGPSGITLDLSKPQILVIDYEWLGVGLVRVGFVLPDVGAGTGGVVYAHMFQNPNNVLTSVYMRTPNLPVRYEIERIAAGPGGTDTLEAICSSVISEGGQNAIGRVWAADRDVTAYANVPTASYAPLIAIRWKAGYYTRSMNLLALQVHDATANGTVIYRLLKNPTRGAGTAPSWTSVDAQSGMEYDVTSTQVITGGRKVKAGYAQGRTPENLMGLPQQLTLNPLDYAATASDEFVLAARTYGGGGGDNCLASLDWVEL